MPSWTSEQLQDYERRKLNAGGRAPCAKSEQCALPSLAIHQKPEGQDSKKRVVRITCFRVRKQDPDNGVYKFHIDAIRAAGLISDDTEEDIELHTKQIKVKTSEEERTEITIEYESQDNH